MGTCRPLPYKCNNVDVSGCRDCICVADVHIWLENIAMCVQFVFRSFTLVHVCEWDRMAVGRPTSVQICSGPFCGLRETSDRDKCTVHLVRPINTFSLGGPNISTPCRQCGAFLLCLGHPRKDFYVYSSQNTLQKTLIFFKWTFSSTTLPKAKL
jgi:hypothetical protein